MIVDDQGIERRNQTASRDAFFRNLLRKNLSYLECCLHPHGQGRVVTRSTTGPITAAPLSNGVGGAVWFLSHILQIHVEKLFPHEEFVAVGEHDFRAHAAVNTVPAAQIL